MFTLTRSRRSAASRRRLSPAVVLAILVGLLVPWTVVTAGTAAAATCPCTIWPSTATPNTPSDADTAAVEVGVKFRADVAGQVTALRFYKGAGNTGTHVGHLWSATGTALATATFIGETAGGWQQVNLTSPVSVAADTTYVASYYAPVGRYAADTDGLSSAVDNAPLHALAAGSSGGNGVYRYGTGGGFPNSSFQASNYWVDVVFAPAPDSTPPAVTSTSPAANATGVATTAPVTATFSELVQPATVQMSVTPAGGSAVSGATSYDSATRTATFTPSAALAASTGYTASVSDATDFSGNAMTPFSWTFTTGTASGAGCPCTIWANTATPDTASSTDSSSVELGVKFRSRIAGYVSGIRFYKGSGNTGTHVGSLWSSSGTKLASAPFAGETASGWQTVTLPAPVAVTANTTYVASYYAPVGRYSLNGNGFASAVARGPLTALANSTSANGVYRYGGGGVFPTDTYQASNYWVDVVFDTTAADTTPPTVTAKSPASGATGVATTTSVSATFNEPVSAASVSLTLTGPSGALLGDLAYDAASTTATFTPASALAANTTYTAEVSGAQDAAGNTMDPVSWTFTTGAASPPALDAGPGGPILVIKNPAAAESQFTSFTAEVLRAEGLNEFSTMSLSGVTPAVLANYDVVVLGRTPLTAAQVSMFSTWVNGGGNLIAFRPAAGLASLLGLTSAGSTRTDGYLKVDTTQAPGAGITDQTVQWHGVADNYTLAGARAVATLYSSATAATANPAVTLTSVGSSGGSAAAFSYDLAQSLVYSRQGNPAWEGQERDGVSPVRSDDMFYGDTVPDYIDLTKVAIPQADEQQRLLANLITTMNASRTPVPRFWYFPRSLKAVVVSTGDDHATGGTAARFNEYSSLSPAGCSVANWQCLRKTSYIYSNAPLTNTQAVNYTGQGFEVSLHPQNGCTNYTATSLENTYASQLSSWGSRYTGIPAPTTNRFHCMSWSDWLGQPTTELRHGIRLETNYYYWPGQDATHNYPDWIQDRPGFMTGSGLPMRFADKNGTLIDVFQAVTQMTDESGQTYPFTPNSLLDNALGPLGYYGAFTVNLHTDNGTTPEDDALLSSATSRGVPLVTSKQMLTWLDGRNASSFSAVSAAPSTLTFTVNAGTGATGLTGMVPTVGAGGGTLTGLARGGTAVPVTTQTIKGVSYGFFTAQAGTYTATYSSPPPTGPTATGPASVTTLASAAATTGTVDTVDTTSVQWTTDRPASAKVVYGSSPSSLTATAADGTSTTRHDVKLRGIKAGRYYYRAVSTDATGKSTVSPAAGQPPAVLEVRPADRKAPAVSAARVEALPDGTGTVRWSTDEPADSRVRLGTSPAVLDKRARDGSAEARHGLLLTDLRPGTRYYYRVESSDGAGNRTAGPVRSFLTPGHGVADDSEMSFRLGSGSGTAVQGGGDGQVALAPTAGSEFQLPQLPASMTASTSAGGSWQVLGGRLTADGATVGLRAAADGADAGPLGFAASFDPRSSQLVGWRSATGSDPRAVIVARSGVLSATTTWAGRTVTTPLPAGLAGASHEYRIDRSGSEVVYQVDGVVVARHPFGPGALVVSAADERADGASLALDWLRFGPAASSGTFTSRVLDAQQMVTWGRARWQAEVPAGTSVTVGVRTGSTASPDASWTGWRPVGQDGVVGGSSRYLQYQLVLTGRAGAATPVVSSVSVTNSGHPAESPGEARTR
ncbi:MAG: DUF4082 domain-containing protein [Mycobacteriales bacterium]